MKTLRRGVVVKKIIFLSFVLMTLLSPFTSFADEVDNKKQVVEDFQITTPEKVETLLTSDNMVITGMGKESDNLVIEVYSVKRNKNKEIKILLDTYELDVDSLKVFAQDIMLKDGENLISIVLNRDSKTYLFERVVIYDNQLNIVKKLDYSKIKK